MAIENGRLVVRLNASPTYVADLDPWHYHTFLARWRDPVGERSFPTVALNEDGAGSGLRLRMSDSIDPSEYEFRLGAR